MALPLGRRADGRDHFALVAAIDAEIGDVNCDHRMSGIELTHADEAKVREVGIPILVTIRQFGQCFQVAGKIESDTKQAVLHKRQN